MQNQELKIKLISKVEKPDLKAELMQIGKDGFELMRLEGEYDKALKTNNQTKGGSK